MRALVLLLAAAWALATDLTPMTAPETRWERGDEVLFVGENHWTQGLYGFSDQLKWHLVKERSALAVTWGGVDVGNSAGLEGALKDQLAHCHASSIVIVSLGQSDARADKPPRPDQVVADVRQVVDRLRERGALVLVATPPAFPKKATAEQQRTLAGYAEALRTTFGGSSPGVGFADIHQAFTSGGGNLTGDERLTQAGHDVAAEVIARGLGALMTTPPMTMALEGRDFIDAVTVPLLVRRGPEASRIEIRFTTNGKEPDAKTGTVYKTPLKIRENCTVVAVATDKASGQTARAQAQFQRAKTRPSDRPSARLAPGLAWEYFPGTWKMAKDLVPGTGAMRGVALTPDFSAVREDDANPTPPDVGGSFGLLFTGYVDIAADGVYRFSVRSDDGSRLLIGDTLVVDNDGWHGSQEVTGQIGLKAGPHAITIAYYQGGGGMDLAVSMEGPAGRKVPIPDLLLTHDPNAKPTPPKPAKK